MRIPFLPLSFVIIAAVGACGAPHGLWTHGAPAPTPARASSAPLRMPVGPMYWVLDGRRLGVDSTGEIAATMQHLDPQSIRTVEVLKGRKAIERFGEEASGGVVIVTTRSGGAGE